MIDQELYNLLERRREQYREHFDSYNRLVRDATLYIHRKSTVKYPYDAMKCEAERAVTEFLD